MASHPADAVSAILGACWGSTNVHCDGDNIYFSFSGELAESWHRISVAGQQLQGRIELPAAEWLSFCAAHHLSVHEAANSLNVAISLDGCRAAHVQVVDQSAFLVTSVPLPTASAAEVQDICEEHVREVHSIFAEVRSLMLGTDTDRLSCSEMHTPESAWNRV